MKIVDSCIPTYHAILEVQTEEAVYNCQNVAAFYVCISITRVFKNLERDKKEIAMREKKM